MWARDRPSLQTANRIRFQTMARGALPALLGILLCSPPGTAETSRSGGGRIATSLVDLPACTTHPDKGHCVGCLWGHWQYDDPTSRPSSSSRRPPPPPRLILSSSHRIPTLTDLSRPNWATSCPCPCPCALCPLASPRDHSHHHHGWWASAAMTWQPWEKFKADHPAAADRMVESWAAVRPYLPPVNFITMHYAYFILVGLIFAGIFYGLSQPANSVSFVDSLFLVLSAFTTSGLNTVDISQLSTAQQVIIALMMVLGSPVFVSIFTIWLRARVFEKRFEDIVEAERNRRIKKTGTIVGMAGAMIGLPVMSSFKGSKRKARKGRHERKADADAFQLSGLRSREKGHDRTQSQATNQEGAQPNILEPIEEGQKLDVSTTSAEPLSPKSNTTTRRRPFSRDDGRQSISEGFDFRTFIHENKKSVGRNGQFFDLTEEEREYLGGVEYRALKILFTIVCVYFVLWQLLGAITLGAWSYVHSQSITAVNSQNSWWAGIFLAISSFNNAGMTLLDAGVAAFDNDAFVLTIVTILSLAGNAAFPAFLRATVYFCSLVLKVADRDDEYTVWQEAFDFILKYPRRLYMMMFPAKANFVFVTMFSTIAVMDWVLLLVLSIGNSAIEAYPVGKRVGLAVFQALSKSPFEFFSFKA